MLYICGRLGQVKTTVRCAEYGLGDIFYFVYKNINKPTEQLAILYKISSSSLSTNANSNTYFCIFHKSWDVSCAV